MKRRDFLKALALMVAAPAAIVPISRPAVRSQISPLIGKIDIYESDFGTHKVKSLSDAIYMIDPTDVTFMAQIDRRTATTVSHEWQIEELPSKISGFAG